ncbi:sigma-70 family RNA polymerase sigma factor [Oceaniferula marina]|uniref:RNA polymerase sigma factor n=1 Tax=Oceaniferula marina TaxID=2748318 RepID=UPI0029C9FD73|nr:sigma-70 family RNA polymerase sigma factor [Oceaniferula marina]
MNILRHLASKGLQGALRAPLSSASTDFGGGGRAGGGDQGSKSTGGTETDAKRLNTETPNSEKQANEASASEDVELVRKAQQGDMRAFDQLVSKHRGKIYAMIRNMVKNDADAWDLSQEAFIKAWRALPKFEARARFSTWLFRISHNVVYDWLRKRRIESEGELNDEVLDASRIDPGAATSPSLAERPDEAMQREELRQHIHAAIGNLSPDHREVILLREVQGLDYKEIAEATGSSMGTIMSRLHYARKKLKQLLSPEA